MTFRLACVGVVLALAFAGAAHAQPARGAYKVDAGGNSDYLSPEAQPEVMFRQGLNLLQQKDYKAAANAFLAGLARDQSNANINYAMGLAQIGLEDLAQARTYLGVAVLRNAKLADAHAKLGYVEAKLGDLDAAKAEREALRKLDKNCKAKCGDAAAIASGLTLLDQTIGAS